MKRLSVLILSGVMLFLLRGEATAQIKVERLDKTVLEKIIRERNGKVLLLNLWATWCVPCREEFPDLIRISDEFKNKNVEVIGISIDYPDEIESKILPFLKKNKADFRNYVNGMTKDEDLINALDDKWNGALPATFIYDVKGNKAAFLEGKRSFKEFKTELEKLVK